ncbi:hypothetical protein GUY60_32185, partial [Streptomyces sp. YC537]|nr:hypothetical protein [Streptomyces boluensis]
MRIKKNGYAAELTDDLKTVYYGPSGRPLKKQPRELKGAPELAAFARVRHDLEAHRDECRALAVAWAAAGQDAPRALAEGDPVWRLVLDEAGVELHDDRPEEHTEGRLFARTYTGPFDVTRTQLLAEDAVPHRDLLMRADGWEPELGGLFATAVPDPSGGELPFPERVLAAHPGLEVPALEKIRTLREVTSRWQYLSKKSVDAVLAGLEQTAPALLVSLLDGVADLALRQEDIQVAAAWFGRARKGERLHAREVDESWLDRRYLTYARAGALSATVLRERARELMGKGSGAASGPERVDRFRAVVIARLQATGELYPQLAADLRKIAKAAGLDPEETLAGLLHEVVQERGGLSLSDDKLWQDCLKGRAVELLRARGPEAAHAALRLRPRGWTPNGELWRELLDRTGALALLTGEEPGLPDGEAARWLSACARHHNPRKAPPAELYQVAELIAPRIVADGVPVEFEFWTSATRKDEATLLDLVDVLLEHGAPVCDPPGALGPAYLYNVTVKHRPDLTHLLADERYARQLRARVRMSLAVEDDRWRTNTSFQPHQFGQGWRQIPALYDNAVGHDEIRSWFARERELLRAGPDFAELVLLLGRLVHVGVAVAQLLKDVEAAAEFAAVDVLPLLTAELAALPDELAALPAGLPGARVAAVLDRLEPDLARDQVRGTNRTVLMEELPELKAGAEATEKAYLAFVMAANCRAGLASVVHRLTPEAEKKPATPLDPSMRLCRELRALAEAGEPVWAGDLSQATSTIELPAYRWPREFRKMHAHAATYALRAASGTIRENLAFDALRTYAELPFVTGDAGRWRIVLCDVPEARAPAATRESAVQGSAFRLATSAAAVVAQGSPPRRVLLEHAPEGAFGEDGPLAAAGATLVSAYVLEPVRPVAWFRRFVELYEQRGTPAARPESALALAEGTGLSAAEAAHVLAGWADAAPHQAEEQDNSGRYWDADLSAWRIDGKDGRWAADTLAACLDPRRAAALVERLLPDDPETLWTTGPDVTRAVAWWQEQFGAPVPVPQALVPLAAKEMTRPEGEQPVRRVRPVRRRFHDHGEEGRPVLRPSALLGRTASGAACLAPDPAGLAGEPDLLALPRVAAWLAYRTPAGDPLRPAVGAAIARLREELATGPGPLHVFSLQDNYLMGAPPLTGALEAHKAVTIDRDETYEVRHLRVDPAQLKGADDPLLDTLDAYLDSVLPSQWLPTPGGLPALADLRLLLDDGFAALGTHLSADEGAAPGWEQHPARSVPHLVAECAARHGLGEDAAALHLILLALPDPTDRNVKQWTGWKPARFKSACTALESTGLFVRAARPRAGRSIFLPGPWQETKPPRLPVESARRTLLPLTREHRSTVHMAAVPSCPLPELFERAWAAAGDRGGR